LIITAIIPLLDIFLLKILTSLYELILVSFFIREWSKNTRFCFQNGGYISSAGGKNSSLASAGRKSSGRVSAVMFDTSDILGTPMIRNSIGGHAPDSNANGGYYGGDMLEDDGNANAVSRVQMQVPETHLQASVTGGGHLKQPEVIRHEPQRGLKR
jgi:hypothetical protein